MSHAHRHFGAEKVLTAEPPRTSADMNVTPLIDVLLVLLVIFMAALPMTQRGMDINLPAESHTANTPGPQNQIVLEVAADRGLSINKSAVTLDALQSRLQDLYSTRHDKTLFLIGAPTLRYGDIVPIIDAAKGAGVAQVGIVTEGMRRTAGVSD